MSRTLWHIQNQKNIQNPGIFTTLLYSNSEPRYIQNASIFKIWGIFRTLPYIYDEALIIFMAIIIFANYNYFRKAKPRWSEYLEVVSIEAVMLCKKSMGFEGVGDREVLIYLLIYSIKLAYLHLVTVLVYRSSPPKRHG